MNEYHKIQTCFKRAMNGHEIIEGEFTCPEFDYLKNNLWTWTEKIDGTNCRVIWDGEKITFGGKTQNASIPAHLVNRLQEIFLSQIELFKATFAIPVCLYGEGYGQKIQNGCGYSNLNVNFALFDVKIGNSWLQREDVEGLAIKLGIGIVPTIGTGTLLEAISKVKESFKSQLGDFPAEGLVLRPLTELKARNGDRIITKIKCRDFKFVNSEKFINEKSN